MTDLGGTPLSERARTSKRARSPNRVVLAGVARRVVPIPIESLVQGVSALWAFEPQVHGDLRSDLIEELNQLEHRVEVLRLRAASGLPVSADAMKDCARMYLRLRERWTGSVAA